MNKQNHQSGHSGPDPAADSRQNIIDSHNSQNMFDEIASAVTRGEGDEYFKKAPEDILDEVDEQLAKVPEDSRAGADEQLHEALELEEEKSRLLF
jgi:hypothetical protein